jgi:hypothetical protein
MPFREADAEFFMEHPAFIGHRQEGLCKYNAVVFWYMPAEEIIV